MLKSTNQQEMCPGHLSTIARRRPLLTCQIYIKTVNETITVLQKTAKLQLVTDNITGTSWNVVWLGDKVRCADRCQERKGK